MGYMIAALTEQRTGLCLLTDTVWLRRWGDMGGWVQYVQGINCSHICTHSPARLLTASEGKQSGAWWLSYQRKICSCGLRFFSRLPLFAHYLTATTLLPNACSRLWNRWFHVTLSPSAHRIRCICKNLKISMCSSSLAAWIRSVFFNTTLSVRAFEVCHILFSPQRGTQHQKWCPMKFPQLTSSSTMLIQFSGKKRWTTIQPWPPATEAHICLRHLNTSVGSYETKGAWALISYIGERHPAHTVFAVISCVFW